MVRTMSLKVIFSSSSSRAISAERERALKPVAIISHITTMPRSRGSFHGRRLVRELLGQCSLKISPPGRRTARPHRSSPFIRTPSMTACPPTGMRCASSVKRFMAKAKIFNDPIFIESLLILPFL